MLDLTKDLILLKNPDHTVDDFRHNNQGKINRVATINYGNGVEGKIGLLRGSGQEEVYAYTFDDEKYDEESAQEWLTNHRSKKAMKDFNLKDKKFKFNMPLTKAGRGDDGYLYLEFALATTDVDLENEQLTPKALEDMATQAHNINVYLDHEYDLDHTVGPVVEAAINGNSLWVKGRVRKELEKTIEDILDSETRMGGSFGGICQEDFLEDGIRKLDKVNLLDATFTPMPVNTQTSGTGKESVKDCTVCNQIFKSIKTKYGIKTEDLEVKNVTRTEDESYEALRDSVNIAVRDKYKGPDGYSAVYVKLTFPDSCIVENWEEDTLYEIPYTADEEGNVTLGEPVEVVEQYVEKKLEVFTDKAIKHEPPADYEKKKIKGDENMDETKVQEMIDKSNGELFDKIKGLIQPEKVEEPLVNKELDKDSLVDEISKGVLKSLGVEVEPEETPEEGKVIIMDAKALEELQEDTIKKTILSISQKREGTRKSKSLGLPKFDDIVEDKAADKQKGGKVSTRKAAEMVAIKKGIVPAK